jgi:methyl-accepting chemotaxis protein
VSLQIGILEESYDLIAPRSEALVERFYERLFAFAPEVKPLFAWTDPRRQRQKLLATLVLLRKSLRNFASIEPALRAMGARHVAYGVRPEHYTIVSTTLVTTMAEIGGSAWTAEYTRAWMDAFQVVQDTMLSGAAQADLGSATQPDSESASAA